MAVKIRLQRFGNTHKPFYRVVAADSRRARDGKFLDILGTYDPLKGLVDLNQEKVTTWINNGAQLTDTVKNLIKQNNKK